MTAVEVDARSDDALEVDGPLEDEDGALDEDARPKRSFDLLVPGLILSVVGLSMVLFVVYVFTFTNLQEARSQRELLNVFTTPAGAVPLSGKIPPDGSPAAVLTIPALHVHVVVVEGTTSTDTAKGPGIMTQAARPGTIGNAVIAGRRSTSGAPFKELTSLVRGDKFELASGLGKFRYVVVRSGVRTAGQLSPASPVNRAQVTLLTSDQPFTSTSLYYVVAHQITAPAAAPRPKQKPTAAEMGLAGDPAAIPASIILGALYVVLVAATVVAYRRYRSQIWTVYVLTTPIILATALWWFENLYRLLPATL